MVIPTLIISAIVMQVYIQPIYAQGEKFNTDLSCEMTLPQNLLY